MLPKSSPQFPLYIVSKGRSESRLTAKSLEAMGVDYRIVIEAQELESYAAVIDRSKILILDPAYQRDYDTFDKLGDSKGKGPGPARNFCWDHSIAQGAAWHWVMDDNIAGFYRLNHNIKIWATTGAIFRAMEDFCLRYTNVAMGGPNYAMFVYRKKKEPPLILNTRIYSCNLIRNNLPFRWRGRYNEDTDLSLRCLKAKWCTIQFNAFLQNKVATQSLPGGNTAEFYSKEGTEAKSRMQVAMHPDVSRLVGRFHRIHHHVDYSPFHNNLLRLKPGLEVPKAVDEFGMAKIKIERETASGKPISFQTHVNDMKVQDGDGSSRHDSQGNSGEALDDLRAPSIAAGGGRLDQEKRG